MKIISVESRVESFNLTRPYTIASRRTDSVENVIVTIRASSGLMGLGAGAPGGSATGETLSACRAGLARARSLLVGRDIRELPALCRVLGERLPTAPAAR
ncbi:MAG TPA: dipeptide epimerase, partial [Thermoanaerobaculia bacterium]|nr:dipeptide epimerase [Thermoanaerobaculia bacterium]